MVDCDRLRPISYTDDIDVILICFSIANPESFQNAMDKWIPEVNQFCSDVPYILVGLKSDLRVDETVVETLKRVKQSPVTPDIGHIEAKTFNAVDYVECSVFTNDNIEQVFTVAIKSVIQKSETQSKTLQSKKRGSEGACKKFFGFWKNKYRSRYHDKKHIQFKGDGNNNY